MDALEANLTGLAPDLRVSLRTEMKDFVNRMLDDRLKAARETKLTWDQRKVRARRPLGGEGLDLLREHVSIRFRGTPIYYIQNCKLYASNGQKIGFEQVISELRPKVEESFENFLAQAIKADPGLCKYCLSNFESFTTENHEEYAEHLLFKHPEVLAAKLGRAPVTAPQTASPRPPTVTVEERKPEPPTDPEPSPIPVEQTSGPATIRVATSDDRARPKDLEPGEYVCNLCGFLAKTQRSLRIHRTHKHRTVDA